MTFTTVKKFVKKNGSAILTGIGCLGVVGTGILAYFAGKNPSNKKLLIPPVVVGGLTIVAIIFSRRIDAKTIMGLTSTGAAALIGRDALEAEIEKVYGPERLQEIKREVARAVAAEYKGQTIEQSRFGGNQLCLDSWSGRVFRAEPRTIYVGIQQFVEMFDEGMSVSFNDLYDLWGIRQTQLGHEFGWVSDESYYVGSLMFDAEIMDNPQEWSNLKDFDEPIMVIDTLVYPMLGWYEI